MHFGCGKKKLSMYDQRVTVMGDTASFSKTNDVIIKSASIWSAWNIAFCMKNIDVKHLIFCADSAELTKR